MRTPGLRRKEEFQAKSIRITTKVLSPQFLKTNQIRKRKQKSSLGKIQRALVQTNKNRTKNIFDL
jgi:hypothetical protein